MTSTYMRDTAIEAGLTTDALLIADIGWDPDAHEFVDLPLVTDNLSRFVPHFFG